MSKKNINNKGYMLVEIIVVSVIALIMAYFLISITINLINKNNDYYIDSVLLTDKNIITKEIMDDINNKQLIKVEKINNTSITLIYSDNTIKNLNIDNKSLTITYGDYVKKLSDKLIVGEITIENTNNILIIKIPAYTNQSKEDYGIKITVPYDEKLEIIYPES